MEIVKFNEITSSEWDDFVGQISESTYMHTSWWLQYLNAIYGADGCKSFILMHGKRPQAICPLFISKAKFDNREYFETTRNGLSSIYPAFIEMPATQRRRLARRTFKYIEEILSDYKVQRLEFYKHPMNYSVINNNFDLGNAAEALSYGYFPHVRNTIIIDLAKTEQELLSEMTMFQRKHITKSAKIGFKFNIFSNDSLKGFEENFANFLAAHIKSAGKMTRPIESWNLMYDLVVAGKAALFTLSLADGTPISYLFCGQFSKFVVGWSQVNIDEYEREYSPRHYLEWNAMLWYKSKNYNYYDLGIMNSLSQLNYIPTKKEITISQFKERYGGKLYSCFTFEKFLDKNLFAKLYSCRIEQHIINFDRIKSDEIA